MSERPRLAVFQSESSVPLLEVVEAASGLCRILWVVGWSRDVPPARLLARFGDVVDVSGAGEEDAVAAVAAERPDGVVVFNDDPLALAAAVALRVGLPFHSPRTAALLTDKLRQREALRDAGLATTSFAAVRYGHTDVDVPFPAVLKPRVGAGARDTFLVESSDQVVARLAMCDHEEPFILEEWLPDRTRQSEFAADMVSVESVVRGGVVDHVVVTGRFHLATPFRTTGSFMPSDVSPAEWGEVTALAAAALAALGVENGLAHTEIKLTPTGPRVIEVNGRLGGGIKRLVQRLEGPQMHVMVMRLALGMDVGLVIPMTPARVAFFRFLVAPEGATSLQEIGGLERLSEVPGIEEVNLVLHPGDAVDSRHVSFVEHAARIEGVVDSYTELATLVNEEIPALVDVVWGFAGT